MLPPPGPKESPPIMTQIWHDLLFAHWRIPIDEMRRVVPESLSLDTYDGSAWLGIVPFWISGFRLRGTPRIPGFSTFPEMNVRTYIRMGDRSGVYFFSLDAANRVGVRAARWFLHLSYYDAEMSVENQEGWIVYESRRTHPGEPPVEFIGRYRPVGPPAPAAFDTLDYWLLERYRMFPTDRTGQAYVADIRHVPWHIQPAEAEIRMNTMTRPLGIALPDAPPILHYSKRQDVLAWLPEKIGD